MINIRNVCGRVVAQSKNLRGIVDRSRKVKPLRINAVTSEKWGTGELQVTWVDQSHCYAYFASASVMLEYIERCRWKRDARVIYHNMEAS
jgi:hypothetical protein